MGVQTLVVLGLLLGSPGTKGIRVWVPRRGTENIIWRRCCLPLSLGRGESCESKMPVACPSTKGAPESELKNLLVGLMQV